MDILYSSKYYDDLTFFLKNDWTKDEINIYFPILESLNEEELLQLHRVCNIKMFSTVQEVDKEQAIHVLVNPKDTSKNILFEAIKNRK